MKTLFLSVFAGLTIGSAIATVDISSPYDENQANTLNDIQRLTTRMLDKDLSQSNFEGLFHLVIEKFIRLHSMRIAPGHLYDSEYSESIAFPYLTHIYSLPVSKFLLNDGDKRIKYATVLNQIFYCLMNWAPFVSEHVYKQILIEFRSQLTAFIKEYTDHTIDAADSAQTIIENLLALTEEYYQEKLTQAQKDILLSVEKNDDASFIEGMSGVLAKAVQETDEAAQESK